MSKTVASLKVPISKRPHFGQNIATRSQNVSTKN